MRRTLASLMILGAISGCSGGDSGGSGGGGGGGGGSTADTQAPIVSLAAPATVEGGLTLALTATATDNVTTGLTPTIACDGGTLTGTMLVTPVVTAATTITCTASATDAAGNTGRATASISVQPTTVSLKQAPGTSTLSQGKYGALFAENLPLEQASYTGKLGGKDVTLYRSDDARTLVFVTPTGLSAGAQTMTVTIGSRSYSFTVQVSAPAEVANARNVVLDFLTTRKNEAQAFLASAGASLNATAKADINAKIAQLQTGISTIDSFSAEDLRNAAIYIQANQFLAASTLAARSLVPSAADDRKCNAAADIFIYSVVTTIAAAKVTTLAAAGIGTGLGAIVFAGGALLTYLAFDKGVLKSLDAIADYCFDIEKLGLSNYNYQPSGAMIAGQKVRYVTATTAATRLGFSNDVPRTFQVQQHKSLFASVAGAIKSSTDKLYALAVANNYVPESLAKMVSRVGGYDENLPASTVALSGITSGVTGSASGSGDVLTLRFKAVNPDKENIDFSFTLTPADSKALPVDATLTLALPKVNDAAIKVTQGQPTSSSLQVSGADTLELVDRPTKGNVALQNNGSFIYTPTGQNFGDDKFTYRGKNANGYSKAATVLVTIERKFDGAWSVTSRSTTTSQSQAGLCPNETNSFTIMVSKVSDTQYTTSYGGFPITLTMSSKDDPAGLSGSTTVTYDDGPGKTTETLNASIPNSSQLTGSGSFSYAGPGNTRCSGTTSVTGVRP